MLRALREKIKRIKISVPAQKLLNWVERHPQTTLWLVYLIGIPITGKLLHVWKPDKSLMGAFAASLVWPCFAVMLLVVSLLIAAFDIFCWMVS